MDLTPSITPDTAGLRALAHPVRLKLLGLLRIEGPSTATSLAARLGLNSGATSYHLRQLADHGFIVDDETRGTGRERWWQAAHRSTRTKGSGITDEAEEGFLRVAAAAQVDQLRAAVDERAWLPDEWRAATALSDWMIRLTPARAKALVEAVEALIEDADEDGDDEAPFVIQVQAFPRPGSVT